MKMKNKIIPLPSMLTLDVDCYYCDKPTTRYYNLRYPGESFTRFLCKRCWKKFIRGKIGK